MKIKARDLTKEQKIETLDALYTAASSLKGREAMKLFLRDLLTESERVMLGRRILIARRLLNGENMRVIAEEMKVGFDTISRVERWLSDQMPGYETAVKEMEKEFKNRKDRSTYGTFANLKKRYPLHFLLFR